MNDHNCNDNLILTLRTLRDDTTAVVNQCTICGRQIGAAQSKKGVELNLLPLFNDILKKEIEEEGYQKLEESFEDKPAFKFFKQIEEECEGNYSLLSMAKQIHIKASHEYAKDFKESPFSELDNEPKLKKWLVAFLEKDFYIKEEVKGNYILTGKTVIVDLMLYPKKHMIENGFMEEYFNIEVKYLVPADDLFKKASEMFWQAISYRDSVFSIKGKNVTPAFTLAFTNLAFVGQRNQMIFKGYVDLPSIWRAYRHLASHAGVGTIEIQEAVLSKRKNFEPQVDGWKMLFATREYFTKDKYGAYKLNNKFVPNKRSAGNIS